VAEEPIALDNEEASVELRVLCCSKGELKRELTAEVDIVGSFHFAFAFAGSTAPCGEVIDEGPRQEALPL
jgi:hypothetical protein